MELNGIKVLPVVLAAIATYAVGLVIYGILSAVFGLTQGLRAGVH